MATRKILGLDPGYGRLGYGVMTTDGRNVAVITCGVMTTQAGEATSDRLHELGDDLEQLMDSHKPDLVVIEELFFAKNVTTGLKVAEVRGVIIYLAAKRGIQVVECKPVEVKMAITGYGKADKKQVQEMVKVVFGLKTIPKPDDAADALAIAWCGAYKIKLDGA